VKQIAIIGRSVSTVGDAPWNDESWEKWGLPWADGFWAKMDRFFEMHERGHLQTEEAARPSEYWERLQLDIDWGPIYMQQAWADIPKSVVYPFEAVNADVFAGFPRVWDQDDWYNCSIAYMLALAIHEKADRIGLWGIDCTREDEYAYENPNLAYLIGFAQGRGIEVILPQGPTNLLKYYGEDIPFGTTTLTYPKRYGYVNGNDSNPR
jgi:hypothetical protein